MSEGGNEIGRGRLKTEKVGMDCGPYPLRGSCRDVIGEKIGMSGKQYDRAKYISENAPDEIIDELDNEKRSIRGTYDELKAKEKAQEAAVETADDVSDENEPDDTAEISDAELIFKEENEAVGGNNQFHSLSPEEKVAELQRQIKESRARACTAESDLARLKKLRHNDVYHRDGIIENLKMRLEKAEARVQELERLYCPDAVSAGSQINDVIPLY